MKDAKYMREWMQKMVQLATLSAEEAAAFINIPVYGLTEEVCKLHHVLHGYTPKDRLRIEYASPHYTPHKKGGRNFVVESRLYEEPQKDPTHVPALPVLGYEVLTGQFPGLDRSHFFVAKDAVFTIDGKCFKGYVSYQTAPVY